MTMQKIKIRLPAVLSEFGTSLGEIGLAISLYVQVELIPREDDQLIVETQGVDAGYYSRGFYHPVVLGMMYVFQKLERSPTGFTLNIDNNIPIDSGLNAESVFLQAGIVAANNIMGNPMTREDLIEFGTQMSQSAVVATTTMLGGLTVTRRQDSHLIYHSLPVTPTNLIISAAHLEDYQRPQPADAITRSDVTYLLASQPLMLDALARNDIYQLAQTLKNPVYDKKMVDSIAGFAHVAEVARLAGALGVTTSGRGPAMVFICAKGHDRVAEVIETAYSNLDIPATTTVTTIDTQGIVLSVMKSGQ
jgi:homoserine kinase